MTNESGEVQRGYVGKVTDVDAIGLGRTRNPTTNPVRPPSVSTAADVPQPSVRWPCINRCARPWGRA